MNYEATIETAINFIESKLFEDIGPAEVAAILDFSEYHLHRIFTAMVGESVSAYIRNRRIFEAARLLKNTDRSIYDLAALTRFESYESFSRAFKKIYGTSPNDFRKLKHHGWNFQKERITKVMLQHLRSDITLNPTIVEREMQNVVGLAASYADERPAEIELLWQSLLERQAEIANAIPNLALGVYLADHPELTKEPGDTYVYLAGFPVTRLDSIPQGMIACSIPKGRYGVFSHKGGLNNIMCSINYIWGSWIPKNIDHYQHVNGPDFEFYDSRFDLVERSGDFDICVPIDQYK